MNWLDIAIIVVLAITTLVGLKTGIIKAVLSLAGLIIGVFLAGRCYVPFSEQLTFIPQAGVAKIVAFAIIVIGVMVIAGVLAMVLKWAASVMMLGWVNRLGGGLFGLAVGAILCGALLAAWIRFFGVAGVIGESMLAIIIVNYLPLAMALLPSDFDAARPFFQ